MGVTAISSGGGNYGNGNHKVTDLKSGEKLYTIKNGDTLGGIASLFKSTIAILMKRNTFIQDKNLIFAGDQMAIPKAGSTSPTSPTKPSKPSTGSPNTGAVTASQINAIAKKYANGHKGHMGPQQAASFKKSVVDLAAAMKKEKVPASKLDALTYIMYEESTGQIGVRNPSNPNARGLFQLNQGKGWSNYKYNPRGEASFGNGIEEAQGGIRYMKARYGTIDKALAYWKANKSY